MKKVKRLIAAVVFLLGITAIGNYFTERKLVSNTYSRYLVLMERSGHKIIASKKRGRKNVSRVYDKNYDSLDCGRRNF